MLEQKRGFVPKAINKEGVGDIDFVWGKQDYNTGEGYGLEHIIDGRTRKNKIEGEKFVKMILKTLEDGIISKDPKRPSKAYIEDASNKVVIPTDWQGKERNWVLTAYPQNKSASKRLAADAPMSKPNVDSRYTNFTTELTADNNILSNPNQNLKPSKPLIKNEPVVKPPDSDDEWRKRLRRKRRGLF